MVHSLFGLFGRIMLPAILCATVTCCHKQSLPQVDFSLGEDKPINALAQDERETFSNEGFAVLRQVFDDRNMCCRVAAIQQKYEKGWDADTCQAEYDRCMQDSDNYPGRCPFEYAIEMDSCSAIVGDVEDCFNDAVQSGEQFYSNITCSHSEAKWQGGPSPPPSCTDLKESCPPVPYVKMTYVPD